MISYGQALMQDEATATQLVAANMAELAPSLLAAYGITLPPQTDLTPLIAFAIGQAEILCESDFAPAIKSTINTVKRNLATNGIAY